MKVIKKFSDFLVSLNEDGTTPGQGRQRGQGGSNIGSNTGGGTNNTKTTKTTKSSSTKTDNGSNPAPKSSSVKDQLLKIKDSYESGNGTTVTFSSGALNRQYDFYYNEGVVRVWPKDNNQLIYRGKFSISGDTVTITSDDNTIKETITISTVAISGLGKTASTRETIQTSAKMAFAEALKVTDINEGSITIMLEALVHYVISNKLDSDTAKQFISDVTKDYAKKIAHCYSAGSIAGTGWWIAWAVLYWTVQWQSEDDPDNQTLIRYGAVSTASRTPKDNNEADVIAQAVWNIIDDTYVSMDEEANAAMGILMLSPQGLAKVEERWAHLRGQKRINTQKTMVEATVNEIDNSDSGILLTAIVRAISGKTSNEAKALLSAWSTA